MATIQRSTVVGIFDDIQQAERAVDALHRAGFTDEQIGFIRRSGETATGTSPIPGDPSAHPGASIGTGAVIGGLIGAAAALLIPGVGPVLAGGILVHVVGATAVGGAVAGAVGGAVAGGLLGALSDMGVPEDEARYADEQFQAGRTIVTVKTEGRSGEASEILHRFGAHDVRAERLGTTSTPPPAPAAGSSADSMRATSAATTAKEIRVPVTEEELVVHKNRVETGQVEIHKEVIEETKTLEVPVRREEVRVERVATNRPTAPGETAFAEETIRVPVSQEEVSVEKRARVTGEVVVDRETVQSQQPVSGTVRRTDVHVDRTGPERAQVSRPWNEVMPTYRSFWQQRYGARGDRWEEIEPAYRFGYESAGASTYQGRSWDQAEADLRRGWVAHDPRTPWEKVNDAIRAAWDRAQKEV